VSGQNGGTPKSCKPEEIVAKLRQVDVLTSQGKSVAEAICSIGVSGVTYYRWVGRHSFGGFSGAVD
jgi:transposase